MAVAVQDKLKMPGSPQAYANVIRTLPVAPISIFLDFYLHDIKPPKGFENPEHERIERGEVKDYLERCRHYGIVPFSDVQFRYSKKQQLIFPQYPHNSDSGFAPDPYANVIEVLTPPEISGLRDALLAPGRVNQLYLHCSLPDKSQKHPECKKMFAAARDFTEDMLSRKYSIGSGSFDFSFFSHGGDMSGLRLGPDIYGRTPKPIIELSPEHIFDHTSCETLLEWFEQLRKHA